MENKKHKINTSTFDHIDKDEFSSILDEVSGDIKHLESTLIRKTVVKLVHDYYDLRNKCWVFNVAQLCIDGILIALIILK